MLKVEDPDLNSRSEAFFDKRFQN